MALADVPAVVQRCVVCRDWAKPGPRNIATFRIILEFNEEAQFDLLFYTSILEPDRGQRTICHLVDACLRWSATGETTKEEIQLLTTIDKIWISIFGPMTILVTDNE